MKQRCFLTVWNIKTWSQQAWNTVLLLKKSSICCNLLGLILIVEWKMPLKALRRFTQLKWAKALKCCEISWLFAFSTWTQELLPVREGTIFVRSFWAMAKMYRPLTSRHKLLHLVSARNVSCQEARKVTLFSYSWNILSALKPWTFPLNSLWYRNFVAQILLTMTVHASFRHTRFKKSCVAVKSCWLNLMLAVHNQEQSSIKFTTKHFH